MQFPDDENGDVLRNMHAQGVDLSSPRVVDFEHVFPDEAAARQFHDAVGSSVPEVKVLPPAAYSGDRWEVRCRRRMIPTHAAITDTESNLGRIAQRFGGRPDGWGSRSHRDGTPAE